MSTQSPRKNRQVQGLKLKQLLQIGVLLGVGIWLLYHLQQHYEGKSDIEITKFSENVSEDIDLGRKDLKDGMMRTEDSEEEEGEEKGVEDHSDDENKMEVQEDVKMENEGSEIKETEIREDEDMVIKENDGEKMEEVGNIQILGAKESKGGFELSDKKIEENSSNETAKNQEIKIEDGKDMDQAKNSTGDSSSFDGQAENRSNEISDGFGGVKDQQSKTDANSSENSIPTEDVASNGSILEHSEELKSNNKLSGQSHEPQTDTNSETSPEKSSSQEKDQKPNDSKTSKPESYPVDIQDARSEIETLPDSGNGNNSKQGAIAK